LLGATNGVSKHHETETGQSREAKRSPESQARQISPSAPEGDDVWGGRSVSSTLVPVVQTTNFSGVDGAVATDPPENSD
jgi:hypothetical protein